MLYVSMVPSYIAWSPHRQGWLAALVYTYIGIITTTFQEKLNEAIMVLNKNLQEVNVQNMNVELVAQMFKNYQSNVLFHLEATEELKDSMRDS
ncbi:hypothetical protein ACJ73_04076 [Blastomyces percursus]|uniref:DASH complex subunit DAD4 n=1 Tax=Blastomyces percursus TaxID=1658174 RepID=A0A1J9Q733_9EURO|nr:hypothetical protein ACJ73_04076 [Blastomyces percursus]